jgi:hypothetical protein
MTRPVRPIALVILTACLLYPGLTMVYQGLYPFWAFEYFNLVGQQGPWMSLANQFEISQVAVTLLKAGLGTAWIAGVLGLWAGDARAYPLALLAAVGTLLYPGGPMVMAVIGLICLVFFREDPESVPA